MAKKTRILYTIPNFRTAGSQFVVQSIIQRLNKEKFEAYISVEKYPELIPDILPDKNKLQHILSGNVIEDARFFARLLKEYKIDLVHSWDYKSQFVEVFGSRLAGVSYLYTKKNAAWSKRWFLKSFLASHIAYDNPEMKQGFFKNFLLKNKISFVPHGVDTALFRPLDVPKDNKLFKLCCIGNICENKNQLFLIERLRNLPSNIHLNLYGNSDPGYLKMLKEKLKQLHLQNRVHFKGFVKNKQLPKVLNGQDVFLLASKKEGLPVSILEALACGLPVLSSDSGGGARYIFKNGQGGAVFDLHHHGKVENWIRKFAENETYYKQKSQEAINLAREKFDLSVEINSYEELYESIL